MNEILYVSGSAFGVLSGGSVFADVRCTGNETELSECTVEFNSTCTSGYYVSVFCSNTTLEDTGKKHDMTWQDRTGQSRAGHDRTGLTGKTGWGRTKLEMAGHDTVGLDWTRQDKT